MGALTLGIVLPAGSSTRGAFDTPDNDRASSADPGREGAGSGRGRIPKLDPPWIAAERRGAADLCEAAQSLGLSCEVLVVPAHSDLSDFEDQPVADLMERRLAGADRVLVVAHGHLGGSGQLHATARARGLPVLGPSELAINRAYDKLWARRELARHNLPVPSTLELGPEISDRELARLGWPCVVKPRHGSAGVGVSRLTSAARVREAARSPHPQPARLLEREIMGREFSVVIVAGEVLGIAELERSISEPGGSRIEVLTCPAHLCSRRRAGLENLARRACSALRLSSGPTRIDLMVSERDNEIILEVEPLPPLHRDSIVARVANAAGQSYSRLCAQLLTGPLDGIERRSTANNPTPSWI